METRVPITHQECIGLNELPKRVPLLSPGIFEAPSLAPSFRGDFKFACCPTHLLSPSYHLLYYLQLTFPSPCEHKFSRIAETSTFAIPEYISSGSLLGGLKSVWCPLLPHFPELPSSILVPIKKSISSEGLPKRVHSPSPSSFQAAAFTLGLKLVCYFLLPLPSITRR